jgi:arsenate reductase
MKFYGLKNCDTCRKAMKALDAAGVDYTYIDVRADGVPEKTITGWLKQVETDTLVNKRSTTWRGLSDTEKAQADTPKGAAALLAANPTLIKRPVIETGTDIHVGWTKETQAKVLG